MGTTTEKSYQTKHGVVAVADALGVRDRSAADPAWFLGARDKLLEQCATLAQRLSEAQAKAAQIETMVLGDTFVFSNEDVTPDGLISMAVWLSVVLVRGMELGLPIRGALSAGAYARDSASIVGPAVTDAVPWQDAADWIGFVATPHCEMVIRALGSEDKTGKQLSSLYPCYEVPLGSGERVRMRAVSWPVVYAMLRGRDQKDHGAKGFFERLSELPIPWGTERKYWNTVRFFEEVFEG